MATPLHPLLFCPLYVTCHTVQHGNHFHLAHKLTEILTTFYITAIITDTWQKIWVCYLQTQESPPKRPAEKGGTFSQTGTGGGRRGISHPNHLNIWKVSWDPLWRKILTFSRRSVGILCWWRKIITWSRRSFGTLRWWRKMITFQGELGPPVGKEK